jgi:single-strand DNA-binding protein
MNDTQMTVIGNVCDDPTMRLTKSGHAVTNFRVASTPRRFDRERAEWVDSATLFVNVTCWRALAENVNDSIHRGQPVVVSGRYYCRPYEVNESKRIGYELEATAVGHDLSRGKAEFVKRGRPGGVLDVAADASGLPVDDSRHWLDLESAVPNDTDRSSDGDVVPDEAAAAHAPGLAAVG